MRTQKKIQKLVNHLNKAHMRACQLEDLDQDDPWGELADEIRRLKTRVLFYADVIGIEIDEERLPR